MADDDAKRPSIPSWQQAARKPPPKEKSDDGVKVEGTGTPATSNGPAATESGLPAPESPVTTLAAEESIANYTTSADQLENMKMFLEDPTVKTASLEKKRAFFTSKGIPSDLIDQALRSETSTFTSADFEGFQKTEAQAVVPAPPPQQPIQQSQTTPPIITYPEFLVEAHKPAPLITPTRIINTTYVAGTIYALLYGASKYLVRPMSLSLSAARHDFSEHTQTKLDEMNERLEKLVSKVPDKKSSSPDSDADSDILSETSDPTELYHRDMGTQTSPLPSRRASSTLAADLPVKKDNLTHSTTVLAIMQSHLSEMLDRAQGLEQSNKARQDSMNKLRAYVDTLMYASPGYGMWGVGSGFEEEGKKEAKEEDVIEEVKKEIRGVKGVLLSAKRFPGVAGRVGG